MTFVIVETVTYVRVRISGSVFRGQKTEDLESKREERRPISKRVRQRISDSISRSQN